MSSSSRIDISTLIKELENRAGNEGKARLAIADKLGGRTPLNLLAAHALTHAVWAGFCEFVDPSYPGAQELTQIVEPYLCEYCAKWHDLEDCQAGHVDEYRKLGSTKEERKKKHNELYPSVL